MYSFVKSFGTAKLKMATLTYAQILAKFFACKSEEILIFHATTDCSVKSQYKSPQVCQHASLSQRDT